MTQPSLLSPADLIDQVRVAIDAGTLISLRLEDSRAQGKGFPSRIDIRPLTIRGQAMYQCALRHDRQETHENRTPGELIQKLQNWFPGQYASLKLYSTENDVMARVNPSGKLQATVSPPSRQPAPTSHDREKQYLIPNGTPCPFLHALGIMNERGRVLSAMHHKFRQINRYLELVDDVYPHLPAEGVIACVDFGCGLSYLTFAVHHLLTQIHGRTVEIVGIDRNSHVIERAQKTADSLQLQGLRFEVADVSTASNPMSHLHLAISLHACDTATDAALAHAVHRKAEVILAAPCCQHELFTRLSADALPLLTRHGILKERFAAQATDALRATALEAAGYRTQVLEFIETEHTPKNLLIRAVRRGQEAEIHSGQKAAAYQEFKAQLGVCGLATDGILAAAGAASGV